MRDRFCWHCGHTQPSHARARGCSFAPPPAGCDCPRYEDGEYLGHQLKRDTYTYSDARRLKLTPARARPARPRPPRGGTKEKEEAKMKPEDELTESLKARRLEVHLAEYAALRGEINQRLDTQRQAFNYTVAVLGAFVAGAALLVGKDGPPGAVALLPHVLLLLPLVVGPLAFIFFDDELVLYRDIFHICLHLREKVYQQVDLTADGRLADTDKPFMVEAEGFSRMLPLSRFTHPVLSYSRWLLFVAPVVIPLLVYLRTTDRIVSGPVEVGTFTVTVQPYSEILFYLDVLIAAVLLLAIISVAREQQTWKHRLGTEFSAKALEARHTAESPPERDPRP